MLNILEYNSNICSASLKKVKGDLVHHGIPHQEWGKRRYQNLDGSLTPLGRIHYGVGEPRGDADEAAERERQNEIDRSRSKSIREMDDRELQEAVNRSRNELMFEQNMMTRSQNFLQSKVTEEQLNQQYDELMYQKSRQKAERWMGRIERLGRFVGNMATTYGKIEDVKGKIEDTRAKRAAADMAEWKAEQEHTKYDQGAWGFRNKMNEYAESSRLKQEEAENARREAKASIKAAAKADKKALKEAKKEAKKNGKDPKYIRKEGDTYIYDDSTKSKWASIKDKIKNKREQKRADKIAEIKSQTKREIAAQQVDKSSAINDFFKGKDNRSFSFDSKSSGDLGFLNNNRKEQGGTNSNEIYKSMGSKSNSKFDWQTAMEKSSRFNGGKIYTEAAWKRRKHIKHSEEE